MIEKLSAEQRSEGLRGLKGWTHDQAGDVIERGFTFRNFSEAFAFMTRV
ncbi:MAG TPA: 4a-hydroxytetrahydrobiopterin dehydratase, partial [Devosia sp.]|nr:4a-hydroxytetrahydrobiopterin dehydratase [Devosia sp.]